MSFERISADLVKRPKTWLVTGCAGFIGSNLIEVLLSLGQNVRGLDNFSTGHPENLDEVRAAVGDEAWERFSFREGDTRDLATCSESCADVDYVLHQAALGSVPRSIADPLTSHQANVDGMMNMLVAARDAKVKRFVYASSSSVYGDEPTLPKHEDRIGRALSPYATTKRVCELFASQFSYTYGLECIGLRYFNVFGPRQDPKGPYAAVIPLWIDQMLSGVPCRINGDGETSRDFCYVCNAVEANILSARTTSEGATDRVYNIAAGTRTTLNELHQMIRELLIDRMGQLKKIDPPEYHDFRPGDVRHSLADIAAAGELLSYEPSYSAHEGMRELVDWYAKTKSG